MVQSKIYSQKYQRYDASDINSPNCDGVHYYASKGEFMTVDISDSPDMANYDNSALDFIEVYDKDIESRIYEEFGGTDKPVYYRVWHRRYASLELWFQPHIVRDAEAILVHSDGTVQMYPGGYELQYREDFTYSLTDYGDDVSSGSVMLLLRDKIYDITEVRDVEKTYVYCDR